MRLKQIAIIATVTLVTFTSNSSEGQAATLVTAELSSYTPQTGDTVLGTCSQVGLCFPGQTLTLSSSVFPFISRNDSMFNVTSVTLALKPTQDTTWSNGISNIFSNIQISPDRKVLTFSGGDIPIGEVLFAAAPTSPSNQQVDSSLSFTGTPVPEPSEFLGTLFLGTMGAGLLLKRYWGTGKTRGS